MKSITKILSFAITALVLSGCETMDTFNQNMQQIASATTPPPAPVINDSLSKICQEAKNNKIRAESLYEGKTLSVTSKIDSISMGTTGYTASLTLGKVFIFAGTPNKNNIVSLSKGQKVNATGTIYSISILMSDNACVIRLKDSNFS